MNPGYHFWFSIIISKSPKQLPGNLTRIAPIVIFLILLLTIVCCESKERFYRPNLPEKLCSLGIIDLDDTILRHISFEKSYQEEYSDGNSDSLRKFSFSISNSNGKLFAYQNDTTKKELRDFKIPSNISFNPGEKYFLIAKVDDSQEIKAETIAPDPPPVTKLISFKKQIIEKSGSDNCYGRTRAKYVEFEISFENNLKNNSYYAVLLEANGGNWLSDKPDLFLLDFDLIACNTPSFFSNIFGLSTWYWDCDGKDNSIQIQTLPVSLLLIEGSKIPDNKCVITIATKYNDGHVLLDGVVSFRIKLISIPKQLYFYEKSLYSYNKNKNDPFAEPIYLSGNIRGGFGVFALCRSTDLIIDWRY
jgi:hypothetical protein